MRQWSSSPVRYRYLPRSWTPTSGAGRTIEYHRAQIRGDLGFRECSVADAEKLTA